MVRELKVFVARRYLSEVEHAETAKSYSSRMSEILSLRRKSPSCLYLLRAHTNSNLITL